MVGEAARLVHKVAGPFDLIVQDGSKDQYETVLDRLVGLLRPRGVLVSDNILWQGDVVPGFRAEPAHPAESTAIIARYSRRLAADPRLVTAFLPVGDGVAVSVKRDEEAPDERPRIMTIDDWLAVACADADRRGLADLKPLLVTLAGATRALREAGWDAATRQQAQASAPEPRRAGPAARGRSGTVTAPLHFHTITELAPLIAAGHVSSEALTSACLEEIAAHDGALRAFITVLGASAIAQARELDAEIAAGVCRGPLHGIPISLKDLIDQQGVPTTAASRVREGHVAACDAPVTARLRGGRRRAHRQDQPARVRVRHDERRYGVWRGPQSARPVALTRRVERRLGRRHRHRHVGGVDRHRHRRFHSHPRGGVRHASDSSPRGARCRAKAWCRSAGRSTTSGRWPDRWRTRG